MVLFSITGHLNPQIKELLLCLMNIICKLTTQFGIRMIRTDFPNSSHGIIHLRTVRKLIKQIKRTRRKVQRTLSGGNNSTFHTVLLQTDSTCQAGKSSAYY